MSKLKSTAKKIIVSLVGFPLVGLGIILIPLPGPGLLISFLGLFVLSLGFDWANVYMEKAKSGLRKIYWDAQERSDKIKNKD